MPSTPPDRPAPLAYHQVQKFRFRTSKRGRVDTIEVLRDIDLAFEAGSFAALVGPSGAGKTTLLRMAPRLEEPNGGMILVDGRDVRTWEPRELRRRVGLVFQKHVLFGESVEDNVAYGLMVRGVPREEARDLASRTIERVGLDRSFLDRRNDALTQGQVARVVLARTLILEPRVLLLDEPTSRLDPETADDMFQLLRDVARDEGMTVIFATSRMFEARQFADRIILLIDGEILANDTAADFEPDRVPEKARRYFALSGM